jgi:hypothetical protein
MNKAIAFCSCYYNCKMQWLHSFLPQRKHDEKLPTYSSCTNVLHISHLVDSAPSLPTRFHALLQPTLFSILKPSNALACEADMHRPNLAGTSRYENNGVFLQTCDSGYDVFNSNAVLKVVTGCSGQHNSSIRANGGFAANVAIAQHCWHSCHNVVHVLHPPCVRNQFI